MGTMGKKGSGILGHVWTGGGKEGGGKTKGR
jgi:hypothetical protein